jgi:hypothetical protein
LRFDMVVNAVGRGVRDWEWSSAKEREKGEDR